MAHDMQPTAAAYTYFGFNIILASVRHPFPGQPCQRAQACRDFCDVCHHANNEHREYECKACHQPNKWKICQQLSHGTHVMCVKCEQCAPGGGPAGSQPGGYMKYLCDEVGN
ncbi:hypothetical protein ACJ73_03698 [Blastomyces percursus]|uniref:Uncharacterized protein n=1 Tax=Blastomyces percursus TaxID=1658174 RepID=A0A1J9Q8S5_9EURO|nr:hypothetical protein ACJ73_03698 [Blastomyces percursus]